MKLKCEDVLADGRAIFEIDKQKVFIPGVLLGEEVEVVKKKRYELVRIITKSNLRIKHECNSFYECGSCQYLHIPYSEEQNIKNRYINNLFKDIYKKNIVVNYMNDFINYRNKVQVTFKESKTHHLSYGLYKEGSHDLISINECLLHNKRANLIIKEVVKILDKYKLKAYDEKSRKGILKHLLIRTSSIDDSSLLTLVLNTEVLPKRKEIVKDILNLNLNIKTIIENYNLRHTSIILSDKEKVIYGAGYIIDEILGYKFKISSNTFFQINHEAVNILYSKALNLLNLNKNDILLDAYSGISTIGICASKYVKEVISIESNKTSVLNANINSKLNNIKNINIICADATNKINEFYLNKKKLDVVILDPPRDGSTKQFIEAVAKLNVKKVCYISCEPQTLKRDLLLFIKNGYNICHIEAVDMFPRTFNLETVVILSK